jgi:hypothetical protein
MGESKDILIRQEIAEDPEEYMQERFLHDGFFYFKENKQNLPNNDTWCDDCRSYECPSTCPSKSSQYDPDHLNPSKGGNRAGDDYW